MNIKVLGSSIGSDGPNHQFLISYLCDDTLAIDAGCIGLLPSLAAQKRIRHVFLSHSHADHTASLPIFLDNVFEPGSDCVTVYGHPETFESLRTDVFNDRVWPDVIRIAKSESAFLNPVPLRSECPVDLGGITVLPVELNHVVPTFGFIVANREGAVAFVSDTAPTERIWELVNETPNLKAVFLEVSFPNEMAWLAEKAMHLTPRLFANELGKMRRKLPVVAVHIKPAFRTRILEEVAVLDLEHVRLAEPGEIYDF